MLDHPAIHSPSFSLCSSHLLVGTACAPRAHGPTSLHEPPEQLTLRPQLAPTSPFSSRPGCFTTAPIYSIRAQALHLPPSCHTPIVTRRHFHTSLSPPNAQTEAACPEPPLRQNTRALRHPQTPKPAPMRSALPASPVLTHPLHQRTFSDASLGLPPQVKTAQPPKPTH